MARKHKRRTRKRNKKGGFVKILGPKMSAKVTDGFEGLDKIRKGAQERAKTGIEGMNKAAFDIKQGYDSRTAQAGSLQLPVPQPPTSYVKPDPSNPETGIVSEIPVASTSMEPKKEKEAGGLLGLGWFGLGGRRLSHSAFINKMLRVRSKSKRNKAIRKYLKGGKKKTKKRKGRKKRRTKRRSR